MVVCSAAFGTCTGMKGMISYTARCSRTERASNQRKFFSMYLSDMYLHPEAGDFF
jgi:hypothetical protein